MRRGQRRLLTGGTHRSGTPGGIDALIVTALPVEYDATRQAALSGYGPHPGVEEWDEGDTASTTPYLAGRYLLADGSYLTVAVARATRIGSPATASVAASLVERLRPRCLAMCGVCAGNPAEVALGDVIIADLAYAHDHGHRTSEGFVGDHRQLATPSGWVRAAQGMTAADLPSYGQPSDEEVRRWLLGCLDVGLPPHAHPGWSRYRRGNSWREQLEKLRCEGLLAGTGTSLSLTASGLASVERIRYAAAVPCRLPFAIAVGPIASGNVVVKDGSIWGELAGRGVSPVIGLEMEAATIAAVAHCLEVPSWVVVKGVTDHADSSKDDRYLPFASRASAEVLWKLLTLRMTGSRLSAAC